MYQYEKSFDCHAFGKEVKRKRKAKGWTQEQLAQLFCRLKVRSSTNLQRAAESWITRGPSVITRVSTSRMECHHPKRISTTLFLLSSAQNMFLLPKREKHITSINTKMGGAFLTCEQYKEGFIIDCHGG